MKTTLLTAFLGLILIIAVHGHAADVSMPGGGTSGAAILGMSSVAVSAPADTNENILVTVTIPANTIGGQRVSEVVGSYDRDK